MSTTDLHKSTSKGSRAWPIPRVSTSTLYSLLTLLPWTWLGLFTLFIALVALQHDHLPIYGNPDPRETGLALLYILSLALIPLTFFTPLLWFGLLIAGHRRGRSRQAPLRRTALYAAGMALFFLVVVGDLWGFVSWLVD